MMGRPEQIKGRADTIKGRPETIKGRPEKDPCLAGAWREGFDRPSCAHQKARSVCVASCAKKAAQLNAILVRRRVDSCMWRIQELQSCVAQD